MSSYHKTQIPVICRTKINVKTLRIFLNAATASLEPLNRHVMVLADPSSNLTDVVTCDSDEAALASVKPLATADRDSGKPMDDLLTSIVAARNKDINKQIAIQLDEPALSDSGTCFVSVPILDATEYSPQTDPTIGFRCRFAHVGAAIAELDDLEALNTPFQRGNHLRNESVRCGGVWDPSVLARLSSQPSLLDQHMATFKPFKGIPPPSRFHSGDMYPVFITAPEGISLDTLNSFISEAYKPYREVDELPVTLSIVNRYEPSPRPASPAQNSDGPTTAPLSAPPSIPEAFASASPQACSALARSRFPAQPDLAWDCFVLLDALTEATRTVVVDAHDGDIQRIHISMFQCHGCIVGVGSYVMDHATMNKMYRLAPARFSQGTSKPLVHFIHQPSPICAKNRWCKKS
ncbi:hypothetical protein MCOR28_003047 [Pyricularia oryzae]|nr:hypothetical protein MCOR26_004952 [Pyricularia oryzae]KAI6346316.1 hypothetical protein MCOR28_003047 [Pyricularia oryzae]KAI6600202.1 hypothetical protein MCOR12_004776 [Pyricularia oryzae]